MTRSATLFLLALLTAAPAFAQTVTSTPIATGVVSTRVFDNGILHGDCTNALPWFAFNGVEGGCGAGFLVGLSATNVIGDAYITTAATGWTPVSSGTSTAFPYPTLTQGVRTSFRNTTAGLSIEANHYWAPSSPYIVHRYAITNTGAAALSNVHAGMFWDYDVSTAANAALNAASYTDALGLISVWSPAAPAASYFGMAALTGTVSGYSYDTPYPSAAGQPQDRAALYTGLTVRQGVTSAARDQRGVIGTGPYAIPAGGTVVVAFASLGGANQAALTANATAARAAVVPVAGEADPSAAEGLSLGAAVPNPAASQATFTFTLDAAQSVRLTVTDVLGREVAVVADGPRGAGTTTERVDTTALPSGVYVARLTAGGQQVTRRFTVAH